MINIRIKTIIGVLILVVLYEPMNDGINAGYCTRKGKRKLSSQVHCIIGKHVVGIKAQLY
jgi:hypothetical protein